MTPTDSEIDTMGRQIFNELSRVSHDKALTVAECHRRVALAAFGALPSRWRESRAPEEPGR